jgi:hypothetical protein
MLQNDIPSSPDAGRACLSPTPANGPLVTTLAPNSDETIAIRRPVTITWTVLDRPTTQGVIQVTARDAVGNHNTDRSNVVAADAGPPTVGLLTLNGGESFPAKQQKARRRKTLSQRVAASVVGLFDTPWPAEFARKRLWKLAFTPSGPLVYGFDR